MALIQDPLTTTWSNEQLRPLCELVYKLKAVADQTALQYDPPGDDGVEAIIIAAAAGDIVDDNAYKSGKAGLQASEVITLMAYINALIGVLDGSTAVGTGANRMPIFQEAAVRPLASIL